MTEDEDLDAIAEALARLRGKTRPPMGPLGPQVGRGPFGMRSGGGRGGSWRRPGDGIDPPSPHGFPGGAPHGADHVPHANGPGAPARLRMLEALQKAGAALTVSEVGEAIGVDQPRASRLIQQATHLGLVERQADPDDARRSRVALTDMGARVISGYRGHRRKALAEALDVFTPEERAEFVRLIGKLASAWPED